MAEDKKAAEQLAIDDIRSLGTHQAMFYEHGVLENAPPGNGEGSLIPVCIGMRGHLTKGEARQAARMWREIVARYPKAAVYLHLPGYDQDPREIWEIVDAARYVRWFARAAGLDDLNEAQRFFGEGSPTWNAGAAAKDAVCKRALLGTICFLSACGVFGDEFKRHALSGVPPTFRQ